MTKMGKKSNYITLEINGWDLGIKFSASHFIPTHKNCSRLHGHDYGIRFKIHGELNENMILMDFSEIKKNLRKKGAFFLNARKKSGRGPKFII